MEWVEGLRMGRGGVKGFEDRRLGEGSWVEA